MYALPVGAILLLRASTMNTLHDVGAFVGSLLLGFLLLVPVAACRWAKARHSDHVVTTSGIAFGLVVAPAPTT